MHLDSAIDTRIVCPACDAMDIEAVADTSGGDYLVCSNCYYHWRVLQEQHARQAFDQQQKHFYDSESLCLTPLFQHLQNTRTKLRIRMFGRYSPKGRIIEVGPGNGDVIVAGQKQGYEIDAVEHAPAMAEAVRQRSDGRVIVGAFEELDFPTESYDAYMSFHVIEHVPDVLAHMQKAHEIVRPGGYAFIATPNGRSWEHRLLGRLSPNYSHAHLQLMSRHSLERLLKASGWTLVHYSTPAYIDAWLRVVTSVLRASPGNKSTAKARGEYARTSDRRGIRMALICLGLLTWPGRALQQLLRGGNELFVVARRDDPPARHSSDKLEA